MPGPRTKQVIRDSKGRRIIPHQDDSDDDDNDEDDEEDAEEDASGDENDELEDDQESSGYQPSTSTKKSISARTTRSASRAFPQPVPVNAELRRRKAERLPTVSFILVFLCFL